MELEKLLAQLFRQASPSYRVSINPGATALTVTFLEATSRAIDLVKPMIPALDAA